MKSAVFAAVWATVCATTWTAVAAPGDGDPANTATLPAATSVVDRVVAQLQASQTAADPNVRAAQLAEAKQQLEAFQRENPTADDSARAEMFLGLIGTLEGKAATTAAASVADPAAKAAQLETARKIYREADRRLSVAVDRLNERIDGLPKFLEAGTPEFQLREALKATFIQARMYHAGVVEELAVTYPADGEEARELFRAAADRYETIYRDYRTLIAGLVARLKEGQCYRNLGDTKRALGLYADILSQPAELAALRRLRVTAMYLSLECWTTPQERLYELAFSQGEEYLGGEVPEEKLWPEWQAVRYHTARGYLLAAESLPADRASEKPMLLAHAREKAEAAGATEGPYRAAAQALLNDVRRAAGEASP